MKKIFSFIVAFCVMLSGIAVITSAAANATLKKVNGTWCYFEDGVQKNTTTLCKYNGVWYYVKNGKLSGATTLCKYNGVWYYVKNGKLSGATTLCKYNGVWYYVKNGKLSGATTLCKYNGIWYYVKNGKLSGATTLCNYNGNLYYIKDGKLCKTTTLFKYHDRTYYICDGKVKNITGYCTVNGKKYYFRKGIMAIQNYEYSYAGFHPVPADLYSAWNLLLVNRDYILPENYKPKLKSLSAIGSYEQLDERVVPYYVKMFNAAAKSGVYLSPVSGYRTYERQKINFDNRIETYVSYGNSRAKATVMASEIILPPGTSEHNAGLAMDIVSLETDFEETAAFRWLNAHAQDYGFILRYPENKTSITKISYEPWHWRFVGITAAKAIKSSGKCLEEYLSA